VFGALWFVDTINYVSTDDAAIDADHVNVSAKALGRIAKLMAAEGDKVEAGRPGPPRRHRLARPGSQAAASLNFAKRKRRAVQNQPRQGAKRHREDPNAL